MRPCRQCWCRCSHWLSKMPYDWIRKQWPLRWWKIIFWPMENNDGELAWGHHRRDGPQWNICDFLTQEMLHTFPWRYLCMGGYQWHHRSISPKPSTYLEPSHGPLQRINPSVIFCPHLQQHIMTTLWILKSIFARNQCPHQQATWIICNTFHQQLQYNSAIQCNIKKQRTLKYC